MASTGKKKTTMAKLARESRLRERRQDKAARKEARKYAAAHPPTEPTEPSIDSDQEADLPETAVAPGSPTRSTA
jgi:hypothetical protein